MHGPTIRSAISITPPDFLRHHSDPSDVSKIVAHALMRAWPGRSAPPKRTNSEVWIWRSRIDAFRIYQSVTISEPRRSPFLSPVAPRAVAQGCVHTSDLA